MNGKKKREGKEIKGNNPKRPRYTRERSHEGMKKRQRGEIERGERRRRRSKRSRRYQ